MAYEIYKQKLSIDEYYNKWDNDRLSVLTNELRQQIYEKYLVKVDVFQRDNFTCQAEGCKTPHEKLTMHHIKWQKNGGQHKVKNCITLCNECHRSFHSGKKPLMITNNPVLPSNIRGHTFKLDVNNDINWKVLKKQMKKFRKTLHDESGIKISWEQLSFLMRWLEVYYDEDLD